MGVIAVIYHYFRPIPLRMHRQNKFQDIDTVNCFFKAIVPSQLCFRNALAPCGGNGDESASNL